MSSALTLLNLYIRRPGLVVRHTNAVVRLLRQDGAAGLRSRIALAMRNLQHQEGQEKQLRLLREELAAMPSRAAANRRAILNDLLPHAADLPVLDVLHSDAERIKIVHCYLLRKFTLFDDEFYQSSYMDNVAGIRPIDHYMKFGLAAGLRPNPYFDQLEYIARYPDVARYGIDPILHYVLFGWREGRSSGSMFDGQYYLETNPDVARAGLCPLHHFLAWGKGEKRPFTRRTGIAAQDRARSRGTILLVSHDAELGGAQRVLQVFARWLQQATRFDVKFVTMRSGGFAHGFRQIADTFDFGTQPDDATAEELSGRLRDWAGPDVKAVFVNSVASGGFLRFWKDTTPVVAFIHELPKILASYRDEFDLIKERAKTIVGCSQAVADVLSRDFGVPAAQLRIVYEFIQSLSDENLVDFDDKLDAKAAIGFPSDTLMVAGCGVLHWRKSPDKFIEVAKTVLERSQRKVAFVWIGGGPDLSLCIKQVDDSGLSDSIRFIGYEADVMRFLNACDVFMLPSEEDPFPLACLEAALALAPIVCFEDAGGIPELVRQGCGKAVPFMDTEAMAEAVLGYVADDEARRADGERSRAVIRARHTEVSGGLALLDIIRESAGIAPHVSVIVPNYNYERFLPERLETIAAQTFQDFELILLDDRSTDGSVAVLEQWAQSRPGTRLHVNEVNTGSPFAQWISGIKLARSDLIWMAEADDACTPNLLDALLPFFADRNVALAYVKSVPVGPEGQVYGDYEEMYLNRITQGRWSTSYVATDHEEAQEGLGIANCIPNASSVVFRKFELEPAFVEQLKGMRLVGDWYFYLRAIRGGLVGYSNLPANLHRRHPATVTSTNEGSDRYFNEFAVVRDYIGRTYRQKDATREQILRFTTQDLDRFGITDPERRSQVLADASRPQRKGAPSLLMVLSDLSPGGGQIMGIRLANAWSRMGWRSVIINVRHFPDHPKVTPKVDPRVVVINADETAMTMREVIDRFDIDVVHSMIWWADRYVSEHLDAIGDLPWVITMHGCYETILDDPEIDPTLPERLPAMLRRATFVHTADKNRRVFGKYGAPDRQLRIENGIPIEPAAPLSRTELGLRPEALVLCLASRGLREKGWLEAAEATRQLNEQGRPTELILLGQGPAHDELSRAAPPFVHLLGHVENPQRYMRVADVGILPSYFVGESMPMALLEFMGNAIPVISTDVGEIPQMVGAGKKAGGIIVPNRNGRADVAGLIEAIRQMADKRKRATFARNARAIFENRFTIEAMVNAYRRLYEEQLSVSEDRGHSAKSS